MTEEVKKVPAAPTPNKDNGQTTKESLPVIEELDRLKLENAELRLRNLGMQHDRLHEDLKDCRAQMTKQVQELEAFKVQLQVKYKVDLSMYQMRAGDGALIPKG